MSEIIAFRKVEAPSSRVGPVDVMGPNAAREVFAWQRILVRRATLSKLAFRVGIELAQSVDRKPGRGYAVRTHAQLMGVLRVTSRSKIQEAIARLQRLGFLSIEVSRGPGMANRYRLTWPPQTSLPDADGDDDVCPF